jgi:hypothetical protein
MIFMNLVVKTLEEFAGILERRDKRQFRKLTKMFEELDEDIIKLKLI